MYNCRLISILSGITLCIGKCSIVSNPDPRFFKGTIDELRIADVAYNADWIRLCFMNQKTIDALVRFQ